MLIMANQNDRKSAVKKLKSLTFSSKSNLEVFRTKLEDNFKTVFLPNNVERSDYKYSNITCDVLAPELYASNRVMLYIHGGSFVAGSRASYRSFCASLATKCFCRVIIPEFRLPPENPYPAANEDIQQVFKALFTEEQVACSLNAEKGQKPKLPEIIIAADGSAAGIACSLIFNLRDRYRHCIKKLILFSPWLDVSEYSKIINTKKITDEIINGDIYRKSVASFIGENSAKNPMISPLLATNEQLANFPEVFIQIGEKEILLEDSMEFQKRLIETGNKCQVDIWPNMMFMFQMADEYLHESHLALDRIGKIVTEIDKNSQGIQIENKPKLEDSLKSEA